MFPKHDFLNVQPKFWEQSLLVVSEWLVTWQWLLLVPWAKMLDFQSYFKRVLCSLTWMVMVIG